MERSLWRGGGQQSSEQWANCDLVVGSFGAAREKEMAQEAEKRYRGHQGENGLLITRISPLDDPSCSRADNILIVSPRTQN